MTENLCQKCCYGNVAIVTLPNCEYPRDMCKDYYIINREDCGDKSIWTCLKKEYYHQKVAKDFDGFFDGMSIDGMCMVVPYEKGKDLKRWGKNRYYYFDLGGKAIKYWLCLRKSALPQDGDVALKVPNHMVGRVIGVNGKNIKYVAETLKRYIRVAPIQRHVVVKK